jgi:diadenosine tetraphosphate (Ap4A) HIT family hydrolase
MSHVGTVILEARRHLLDFGEMTSAESAEFGSIMRRLVQAVKAVTGAHRVYFPSVNEHAPHFHLWLVPKKKNTTLEGIPFLARRPVPATKNGAEAMCARSESSSIDPEVPSICGHPQSILLSLVS